MAPLVAIADDDRSFATYLQTILAARGYQVRIYGHGQELLTTIREGEVPDVVLLDVVMPDMDGLTTLKALKVAQPGLPVIMLSGRDNAATIVEAINLGAVNYVVKSDNLEGLGEVALDTALKQALEKSRLVSEVTELRRQVSDDQAQAFWEKSPAMRHIATIVDRVADNDVVVLIRGASGVGKELVARAIHDRSARRNKPFVNVNCAALPDELLESELFGHEKGAFTGAVNLRIGKFEHADGGTLVLDEIGEMKPALQGKLLHVLQDGEFTRLGSNKRVATDVRIIAATNRDLEGMLTRSEFREDLYYRLKVIEVTVPSLRDRLDEIPYLVDCFINKYAKRYNRRRPTLSQRLQQAMQNYSWPGNVRELENVIKRYVILQDETLLQRELLADPPRVAGSAPPVSETAPSPEIAATPEENPASMSTGNGGYEGPGNGNGNGHHTPPAPAGPQSLAEVAHRAMVQAERDLIVPTLRRVHWNRRKAAPLLGVSYKTLLNKIKEHGIVQD